MFKIGTSNVTEIALHNTGLEYHNTVHNARIYTVIMSCGSNCSDYYQDSLELSKLMWILTEVGNSFQGMLHLYLCSYRNWCFANWYFVSCSKVYKLM